GRAFFNSRSEYTSRAICLTASAAVGTPERKEDPAPSRISGHGSSVDRSSGPSTDTASLLPVISDTLHPQISNALFSNSKLSVTCILMDGEEKAKLICAGFRNWRDAS